MITGVGLLLPSFNCSGWLYGGSYRSTKQHLLRVCVHKDRENTTLVLRREIYMASAEISFRFFLTHPKYPHGAVPHSPGIVAWLYPGQYGTVVPVQHSTVHIVHSTNHTAKAAKAATWEKNKQTRAS